jgi:hypothetical protein
MAGSKVMEILNLDGTKLPPGDYMIRIVKVEVKEVEGIEDPVACRYCDQEFFPKKDEVYCSEKCQQLDIG